MQVECRIARRLRVGWPDRGDLMLEYEIKATRVDAHGSVAQRILNYRKFPCHRHQLRFSFQRDG